MINILHKLKPGKENPNEIVKKIQKGDTLLREKFIHDYQPFILKTVSSLCGKYIEIENSDEFSIGLMAFNEAIQCFNEKMNRNFLSFSHQVIKRRLIDYQRKNEKSKSTLPFTYFESNDHTDFEANSLLKTQEDGFEAVEVMEQILCFESELIKFGITFRDLSQSTPKHADSRALCIRIARTIAQNPHLVEKLLRTKNIPLKGLLELTDTYHGTIEKNRKYIIALALILSDGLDILKGYIGEMEKGGDTR